MVPGWAVGGEDTLAEKGRHELFAVVAETVGIEVRGQNGFDVLGLSGDDYARYSLTVTVLFIFSRLIQ